MTVLIIAQLISSAELYRLRRADKREPSKYSKSLITPSTFQVLSDCFSHGAGGDLVAINYMYIENLLQGVVFDCHPTFLEPLGVVLVEIHSKPSGHFMATGS